MNEINKLTKEDTIYLKELIINIRLKDKHINIKKFNKSDFYNVNKRMFKIIFHYDALGNTIIDSIRKKIEKSRREP